MAVFLTVVFLCTGSAIAQEITEILDASGDGQGNVMNQSRSVAVDSAGNAYVAGWRSYNVLKITPSGSITEIIDETGDGAGNSLLEPFGVAVDGDDNVYVAGVGSDNVFKITPSGTITEIIDSSGDGNGNTLDAPLDVEVNDDGVVYVTAVSGLFLVNPVGLISDPGCPSLGTVAEIAGSWNIPHGLVLDHEGDIYLTSRNNDRAYRISAATISAQPSPQCGFGAVATELINASGDGAGNSLETPIGIAVDSNENVYVSGNDSDNLFKIAPSGIIEEIMDFNGDGLGNFLIGPHIGLVVDAADNLYVSGANSSTAFRIDPSGAAALIIDSSGDGAGNTLGTTFGELAVDLTGDVFVPGSSTSNAFRIASCGIRVGQQATTTIHFQSDSSFAIATGLLSDVRASGGFAASTCLGTFVGSPALDGSPDPPVGEARYYLVKGVNTCLTYGDSSLPLDPRDSLDAANPCP